MFRPAHSPAPRHIVLVHWFLMAGNAGFINAGAFIGVGTFATHVTGFATLFGVHAAQGELWPALTALFVPLFFLLGAFLAGWWVDLRLSSQRTPRYDWVMGLAALLLGVAALLGFLQDQVAFGQDQHFYQHAMLLSLLCFASGLQNAALTTSSGQSIRTSHLSGITTDLGRGLAQWLSLPDGELRRAEALRARLRAGTILSFILGSVVGVWAFHLLGRPAFAIPAFVCFYAAWHGRRAVGLYEGKERA